MHRSQPSALDVDIYHVGHHGADNGTTTGLLAAVTPQIAIVSMGLPGERGSSTAWDHGHPRRSTVEMMQTMAESAFLMRETPRVFEVFDRQQVNSRAMRVDRWIYGTAWEGGDVVLRATSDGQYRFVGL